MWERGNTVETCVLLSKLKSTQYIEVKVDLDEIDLTKAESKATYAEIKAYVLEKHGLKVSQLYIAQVKRKYGIIERVNYNVGEGKAKVPQVPMEKENRKSGVCRHLQILCRGYHLLGRASTVKNFRLGLKYLTADVLPNTMQGEKYPNDFKI